MARLSKDDTVKGQIIFGVLIVALLMKRLDKESGIIDRDPTYQNLAVEQCTALIDEILLGIPEPRRSQILHRVEVLRERLTKRTYKLHVFNSFLGALNVLCTNYRTRAGTRLDYLVNGFRTHGEGLRNLQIIGARPEDEDKFIREFKECILRF
jgi:hypothetical protein